MIAEKPVNYMSQAMREHLESNAYALRMFQHPENIQAADVLQDFLWFLERDSDEEPSPETLTSIKKWVDEFLGYTLAQVKQAEAERLDKWMESVR